MAEEDVLWEDSRLWIPAYNQLRAEGWILLIFLNDPFSAQGPLYLDGPSGVLRPSRGPDKGPNPFNHTVEGRLEARHSDSCTLSH